MSNYAKLCCRACAADREVVEHDGSERGFEPGDVECTECGSVFQLKVVRVGRCLDPFRRMALEGEARRTRRGG